MSELDLDAIRARMEAATPAPWTAHDDGLVWPERMGDPVSGSAQLDDAEFIAAARSAVPALLAALEEARRTVQELLHSRDAWQRKHDAALARSAALLGTVELMRPVVEAARFVRRCGYPMPDDLAAAVDTYEKTQEGSE